MSLRNSTKFIGYQEWINAARVEDKEAFKKQLASNTFIWDTLFALLDKRFKATEEVDFDKPNWYERHLMDLGYQKALRDLAAIIPQPKG